MNSLTPEPNIESGLTLAQVSDALVVPPAEISKHLEVSNATTRRQFDELLQTYTPGVQQLGTIPDNHIALMTIQDNQDQPVGAFAATGDGEYLIYHAATRTGSPGSYQYSGPSYHAEIVSGKLQLVGITHPDTQRSDNITAADVTAFEQAVGDIRTRFGDGEVKFFRPR